MSQEGSTVAYWGNSWMRTGHVITLWVCVQRRGISTEGTVSLSCKMCRLQSRHGKAEIFLDCDLSISWCVSIFPLSWNCMILWNTKWQESRNLVSLEICRLRKERVCKEKKFSRDSGLMASVMLGLWNGGYCSLGSEPSNTQTSVVTQRGLAGGSIWLNSEEQ